MKAKTIALLGAGSWGTAIAIHLAKGGNRVLLWGKDKQAIKAMHKSRCNNRYLPNILFPDLLEVTDDLQQCQQQADHMIIAVPSHAFAGLLQQLDKPTPGIAWLTKGLEPQQHCLLSQLVTQRWGKDFPVAIISGPSFAMEVAQALPTALTLASNNPSYQKAIHHYLHQDNLRVYLSHDIIGVQLCGAIKNVLAIACGISYGLGYGANAQAALITRGLAEMRRLGLAIGAKEETFLSLAGLGDLVLTCTDNQSRNRRFGLKLGQGLDIATAEKEIGQVVEGKDNAAQVCRLAQEYKVEVPISTQVNNLLQQKITPQQAVINLMSRQIGEEL